jgi:hypothetical protein
MGRKHAWLSPSGKLSQRRQFLDRWWPETPILWIGVFALLYIAVYPTIYLFSDFLDIVPDRISLIYLPAFVRVIAVMVAGLAGLVGVMLGSLFIALVVVGDTVLHAAWIAVASSLGMLMAYWLLLSALNKNQLPITLPIILVLAIMGSALTPLLHGVVWGGLGGYEDISVDQIAWMMVGDLLGVLLGFWIMQLSMKFLNAIGFLKKQN